MAVRFLNAGDCALTLEFGDAISPELVRAVIAADQAIAAARERDELPGVIEAVPTFRSLTVLYDPLHISRAALEPALARLLAEQGGASAQTGRRWRLPVCYGGEYGPDLAEVAAAKGLTPEEAIRLHQDTEFLVYMLGFLPGFPYMGDLPEALILPRRAEPRLRLPTGSVAIAGTLTAIYPWESPGGWHLIGRCPVPLFDAHWREPALLRAGDRVRFEPVSPERFQELSDALAAGRTAPAAFLEQS
ncbi:MAG: 5-oxoprolinase subunit PxpB [Pseudomonadota bacterium]